MKIRTPVFMTLLMLCEARAQSQIQSPFNVPISFKTLAPCPDASIDAKSPQMVTTIVRVLIKKNLNVTDGKRRAKRSNASNKPMDDESEYNGIGSTVFNPDPSSPDYSDFINNPYHIYLHGIDVSGSSAKYIQIKIILNGTRYKFYGGGAGISFDSQLYPKGIPWLCQNSDDATGFTAKAHHPMLTFYAIKGQPSDSAQINLTIQSQTKSGAQTPIIIDPKIKNDG